MAFLLVLQAQYTMSVVLENPESSRKLVEVKPRGLENTIVGSSEYS
jgi:hypothetical protein